MITLEHKKLLVLATILAAGYLATTLVSAPPVFSGLSTVLAISITANSGILATIAPFQLYISLILIGLLVFSELTDPSYGGIRRFFLELRTSFLPYVVLLVVIFSLIVAFKVAEILSVI